MYCLKPIMNESVCFVSIVDLLFSDDFSICLLLLTFDWFPLYSKIDAKC